MSRVKFATEVIVHTHDDGYEIMDITNLIVCPWMYDNEEVNLHIEKVIEETVTDLTEGIHTVIIFGEVTWTQDYFGEWDSDSTIDVIDWRKSDREEEDAYWAEFTERQEELNGII